MSKTKTSDEQRIKRYLAIYGDHFSKTPNNDITVKFPMYC